MSELQKRPDEIISMGDDEFMGWIEKVAVEKKEDLDRKGPIKYIVEDTMEAGEAIGNKINEVIDEGVSWWEARNEANEAEARANEMEERVRERKRQLGR